MIYSFLKKLVAPAPVPARPATAPRQPPPASKATQRPSPRPNVGAKATDPKSPKVFDVHGEPRLLGQQIARGGEGEVYQLAGDRAVLVKIYKTPTLAAASQNKIRCMTAMEELKSDPGYAWPRIEVFNQKGDMVGFAMRKLRGVSMHTFGNPLLVREKLPGWTRADTVDCALSFLEGLRYLHQRGILVGDINPGNFMIYPEKRFTGFIDCDSYQITGQGGRFLCGVGIHQYMAPESIGQDWRVTPRTVEQENFAAAILVYRMLMLGGHPYAHTHGDDPATNILNGKCPLGVESGCRMPRGPWYNIWSHLPFRTKNVFIRMFRDGHSDPGARPDLSEFIQVLHAYKTSLGLGHVSNELAPSFAKPSEGWQNSSSHRPRVSR